MARTLAALVAVAGLRRAQAQAECNIMDMYAHLLSITSDEECRSGRNEGHGDLPGAQGEQWFPGATDYCNAMCGATFEPFWDQCGATLSSMNMGGMEEMGVFCESPLALLCSAPFCLSARVAPHGGRVALQTIRASSHCTHRASVAPSAISTRTIVISTRSTRPAAMRAVPTATARETCHTSAQSDARSSSRSSSNRAATTLSPAASLSATLTASLRCVSRWMHETWLNTRPS